VVAVVVDVVVVVAVNDAFNDSIGLLCGFNSMPKTYPCTTVHHWCLKVAVVAVNCPNCRHFLLNRSGNVA